MIFYILGFVTIFGFAIENRAKTGLGFLFYPGLKPGATDVPPIRGSAKSPIAIGACVPIFTAMDVSYL